MSFAQNIKKELVTLEIDKYCLSELAALVKIKGSFVFAHSNPKIIVTTENPAIARRIFKLVKFFFNQSCQISIIKNNNFAKKKYRLILIKNVIDILDKLNISFVNNIEYENFTLIQNEQYKRAFIRGAFLASGSINNPQTAKYHFEIKDSDYHHACILMKVLNSMNLKSKIIKRKDIFVVYVKEAEKISDILGLMNASNAVLFYENIRLTRDIRNQANRIENFEQANYEKSFNAAQKQLQSIKNIEETIGLNILDEKYQILCKYRKIYPEYSLSELADIMSDELSSNYTKSKLNHWFRKINEKAGVISKGVGDIYEDDI
ncbi:MAG: DNA-binding protein WhiA [Bacilli bacterium]